VFYAFPLPSEEIKQGDIFMNIPCVELGPLDELLISEEGAPPDKMTNLPWHEVIHSSEEGATAALVGIYPVPAIVITQSCDAARKDYITLCEIIELSEIKAFCDYKTKSLKNLAQDLVDHNRKMPEIFYLPPDSDVGFTDKMVAVFSNTIRVPREELERLKNNRKGRLNDVAYEHFREKLAHFFHRYAFNEWYILSKKELEAHKRYQSLDSGLRYDHQK